MINLMMLQGRFCTIGKINRFSVVGGFYEVSCFYDIVIVFHYHHNRRSRLHSVALFDSSFIRHFKPSQEVFDSYFCHTF